MLAVKTYTHDYIDTCRARIDAQLDAYDTLAAAVAKSQSPEARAALAALAAFEPLLFNSLALVLDASFVHRTRAVEGKDGNPLNEVRMISDSLLANDGALAANNTIKYRPEAAVLHLDIGDDISLDAAAFRALASAYFDELQRRFT
jgi:hypothetical protein